jgi:hypothetical protein
MLSFEANTPELQRQREMQKEVAACHLEPQHTRLQRRSARIPFSFSCIS